MKHRNSLKQLIQPMSPKAYAVISLISFLIGMALLLLFIFKAKDLITQGIDLKIFYVLLIPLGLSSAAFLFGVMKSYASYKGKAIGGVIEIGGPAVIFFMVVIGGFYLVPASSAPFGFTVYVYGKGFQDTVLINKGEVMIDFGRNRIKEKIGCKGEALFSEIPIKFKNQTVPITVIDDEFEPVLSNMKYLLSEDTIYIQVHKKEKFSNVFGIVRDEKNRPIPDVSISIDNISTTTNDKGRFDLKIPPDKQNYEYTLEAWINGYQLWKEFVYPGNQSAITITLKKVQGEK